jgi:hypothetical protein
MPSQESKWYKDIRLIKALDEIRQKNLAFMSYCYCCDAKSIGIKAVKEKLYPVCEKHDQENDINKLLESQSSFEE